MAPPSVTAGIPRRSLIVSERLAPGLGGERAGEALAHGMERGGAPAPGICVPAPARRRDKRAPDAIAQRLAGVAFDARMLESRAVVIVARVLEPRTLAGSLAFEVATRARQSGVPCYAVAARDRLGSFDARVLDLQVVMEAATERELERAGRELAQIV